MSLSNDIQCPFKALFRSIHVKALTVLPGDIVETSPHGDREIAVLHLDVARLNSKAIARLFRDVIAHHA